MMKKLLCFLLCCMTPLVASAEPLRLLYVDGSSFPGIQTADVEPADPLDPDWEELMGGENAPDLMAVSYEEFCELKEMGALADLSESDAIQNAVGRMVPWALTPAKGPEGELFGVPQFFYLRCLFWNEDAFSTAGFSLEDAPESYEELLDFLENWVLRLKEEGEQPVCVFRSQRWNTGAEEYNHCYWLMETLLAFWESQQKYAGEEVRFDLPEFCQLAERARDVAEELHRLEPGEKKRKNMPELFTNTLRGGSSTMYYRREKCTGQAVPSRISVQQPELTLASTRFLCVRKGSDWQKEATAYIENFQNGINRGSPMLYMDFPAGTYEKYSVSQSWLDDYHAYAGAATGVNSEMHKSANAEMAKEKWMMQFFQGKISGKELAVRLDEAIR